MSRRVLAHMVTRNEAGRYLQCVLASLFLNVDAVHVYDDLSTDETVVTAMKAGAIVTRRPPLYPGFAAGESAFRQVAWEAMEEALRPGAGDWILAVDADELLIAPHGLWLAIQAAESAGAGAVVLPIPEVFDLTEGHHCGDVRPWVRTDGFWGELTAPRLARYEPGGAFKAQALACGSVPTYVSAGAQLHGGLGVELLHLGYAVLEDRLDKHRRYADVPGHSAAHIDSILTVGTLEPWRYDERVWRGRRG